MAGVTAKVSKPCIVPDVAAAVGDVAQGGEVAAVVPLRAVGQADVVAMTRLRARHVVAEHDPRRDVALRQRAANRPVGVVADRRAEQDVGDAPADERLRREQIERRVERAGRQQVDLAEERRLGEEARGDVGRAAGRRRGPAAIHVPAVPRRSPGTRRPRPPDPRRRSGCCGARDGDATRSRRPCGFVCRRQPDAAAAGSASRAGGSTAVAQPADGRRHDRAAPTRPHGGVTRRSAIDDDARVLGSTCDRLPAGGGKSGDVRPDEIRARRRANAA